MVNEIESSFYGPMYDEAEKSRPRYLARWQIVGLVFLAVGLIACTASMKGVVSIDNSNSGVTQLAQEIPEEMVLRHFQGSTAQFSVVPGGRFSSSTQSYHAGSKTSAFLLDHRLQYIVEGEIYISDGTGQTFLGKAGDLFYLAYGSNVTYYTPTRALTWVSIANEALPIVPSQLLTYSDAYQEWVYHSAHTTAVSHFPQIKDRGNKEADAYWNGLSPGESLAFFDEIGCFKFNGTKSAWNFCCGVFYLKAGPPFISRTYKHHEEIDFIIDGEFQLQDANGQNLLVKQGDLVHNPRRMDVRIETLGFSKWLATSMSDVDDFWR